MAVYTEVGRAEVDDFVKGYGVGRVRAIAPIPQGIENSIYRVWADADGAEASYVLTLFEHAAREEVLPVLELSLALARRGVPSVGPLLGARGILGTLRGKPACLVPYVEGEVVWSPSPAHLEALGRVLAGFHLAGADLSFRGGGAHTVEVLTALAEGLARRLAGTDAETARLLVSEAEHQRSVENPDLPCGVIHGDLFRDNVLFERGGSTVRALLDFHLAERGPWVYDLAVVLCDAGWADTGVSGESARALLRGYRPVRPLEPAEVDALPAYLRRAALRFLCLRLEHALRALEGVEHMVSGSSKDPAEYAAKLEALRHETV